jgi:hypothetical protein
LNNGSFSVEHGTGPIFFFDKDSQAVWLANGQSRVGAFICALESNKSRRAQLLEMLSVWLERGRFLASRMTRSEALTKMIELNAMEAQHSILSLLDIWRNNGTELHEFVTKQPTIKTAPSTVAKDFSEKLTTVACSTDAAFFNSTTNGQAVTFVAKDISLVYSPSNTPYSPMLNDVTFFLALSLVKSQLIYQDLFVTKVIDGAAGTFCKPISDVDLPGCEQLFQSLLLNCKSLDLCNRRMGKALFTLLKSRVNMDVVELYPSVMDLISGSLVKLTDKDLEEARLALDKKQSISRKKGAHIEWKEEDVVAFALSDRRYAGLFHSQVKMELVGRKAVALGYQAFLNARILLGKTGWNSAISWLEGAFFGDHWYMDPLYKDEKNVYKFWVPQKEKDSTWNSFLKSFAVAFSKLRPRQKTYSHKRSGMELKWKIGKEPEVIKVSSHSFLLEPFAKKVLFWILLLEIITADEHLFAPNEDAPVMQFNLCAALAGLDQDGTPPRSVVEEIAKNVFPGKLPSPSGAAKRSVSESVTFERSSSITATITPMSGALFGIRPARGKIAPETYQVDISTANADHPFEKGVAVISVGLLNQLVSGGPVVDTVVADAFGANREQNLLEVVIVVAKTSELAQLLHYAQNPGLVTNLVLNTSEQNAVSSPAFVVGYPTPNDGSKDASGRGEIIFLIVGTQKSHFSLGPWASAWKFARHGSGTCTFVDPAKNNAWDWLKQVKAKESLDHVERVMVAVLLHEFSRFFKKANEVQRLVLVVRSAGPDADDQAVEEELEILLESPRPLVAFKTAAADRCSVVLLPLEVEAVGVDVDTPDGSEVQVAKRGAVEDESIIQKEQRSSRVPVDTTWSSNNLKNQRIVGSTSALATKYSDTEKSKHENSSQAKKRFSEAELYDLIAAPQNGEGGAKGSGIPKKEKKKDHKKDQKKAHKKSKKRLLKYPGDSAHNESSKRSKEENEDLAE